MKEKISLPIKVTKKIGSRYQETFNEIEKFLVSSKENSLPDYIVKKVSSKIQEKDDYDLINRICTVGTWRINKSIFSFDDDFANELIDSYDINDDFPFEVLSYLPYSAVYIDNKEKSFFAMYVSSTEHSSEIDSLIIYFPCLSDADNSIRIPLYKSSRNLVEAFNVDLRKRLYNNIPTNFSEEQFFEFNSQISNIKKDYIHKCKMAIPLLMYICCANAEVVVDEEQEKIYEKPVGTPKDRQREIKKYNVGYRIGKFIKNNKTYETGVSSSVGKKKSAHMRRGHYHHYWTGKRNGKRTLILKWIAPSFINYTDCNSVNPIIYNIKEDVNE